MSDHEIIRLKRELTNARKIIEKQKTDMKIKEDRWLNLEEEADFYQNQNKTLVQEVDRLTLIVQDLTAKPKDQEKEYSKVVQERDLFEKGQRLEIEKNRSLQEKFEMLEAQVKIYQSRLRDVALKHPEDDIIADAENFKDEVLQNRQKNQQLAEKCNNMAKALEQYSAENRVLRKMAGVPDDYVFEVNDIIQEGQMQAEKYRAQVRALEEEVEELEEERARLRRRLRENQYGGDVPDEVDESSRSKLTKENKQLQEQIKQLTEENDRLKMEPMRQNDFNQTQGPDDQWMKQNQTMMEQIAEIKKALLGQGQLSQLNQTPQVNKSDQNISNQRGMPQGMSNFALPPNPLPGAFGNYNDIKEGYSYRFNTKLPVDMTHLYGDSGSLDQMQVKYEIASLQLQNIETLRLLQEKEKEYYNLKNEVEEIKDDVKKKCLLVQDQLFLQYIQEKNEWDTKFGDIKEKYQAAQEQLAKQKIELIRHEEFLKEIERRDPYSMEAKLADMTKRSAILDVNLIKLSRKYDALTEDYKQIKSSFIMQQTDYIEREKDLLHKVYTLVHWKRVASSQMKVMLQQLQNSVPREQHHTIQQKLEDNQDKLANALTREAGYIKKIATLESSERDLYEKSEKIRSLEEELIEVQLEEEVIKKRLEAQDSQYRKFTKVYNQIVEYIKLKGISPLQFFQMCDENNDGKISKNEFLKAINEGMQIKMDDSELEVLYMFVDMDGTGDIEYNEFVRRLRRSGVTIRRKEDELLYTLYRAIQDAGLQPRTAFEIFDQNGDRVISKQDMSVVLKEMNINVSDEVINYIFKIADTSGDDQIQYDEFINLFDGIIKNQMSEDNRIIVGELDWKMQAMLKIDNAVKDQNLTLLDAFKMIDRDESQTISLKEFILMFNQMSMGLPDDAVKDLFRSMDRDRNGEVSYNEMLNFLREAKLEEEKLKKLKFIQERTLTIRNQSNYDDNMSDVGRNMMTKESRLEMKIAILENREKNANQRLNTLIQQLAMQDGMVKDLNKQVHEFQKQVEKQSEQFYKDRDEIIRLKEQSLTAISKVESEKLKRQNEMQRLQITELNSALTTYRNLYDMAVTQTKIMRITVEKIKNDHETLNQTIKELQSSSDQNSAIGKLYHNVMISRWNEGQTNQKYEKLLDDLRRLKLEEASYETLMKEKSDEIQEQTQLFRETIHSYEKQVSELKAKLLPTVTLSRVEEQANRIKEIAEMKFEVEKQNRTLREQFYELQLKADYFDIYKTKLDELEQRLKTNHSDELSQQIIEVSEKYAECKIELLKTQRDLQMAREKEDYYQRLNRQYTDTIKKLEFDLSNSDLVLRKREEDWRRKFYEQRKQIFNQVGIKDDKKLDADGNPVKPSFLDQRREATSVDAAKRITSRLDAIGKLAISEQEYTGLKQQIETLDSDNKRLMIENEGLQKRLQAQSGQAQHLSQQYLDNYTKDVIAQEAEKLSMAAQQTIRTLQDIIRDKEAEVERKEQQIEQVKKEAMIHKKKDLEQIQQLNEVIHQRNRDRLTEAINIPTFQGTRIGENPETAVMLQSYQTKLKEKDDLIKEIEIQLEAEKKALRKLKEDHIRTLNEKEQLQGDLLVEQKRNETEQYRKQVERLQKLVNSKNKELQNIKNTVTDLKTEVFKMAEETVKKEQDFQVKESKINTNNTELEMKMKRMLDEVKLLKREIKLKHDELEQVKMQEIELKAKVTDLTKQNIDLKAIIKQSGGRGDADEQVDAISRRLNETNKLSIENAQLQREIAFLKQQGVTKSLFDKDGNLLNQTQTLYFKSANDIVDQLRSYLQTKPKIDLLQEFRKFEDKTKKIPNQITPEKFFEVLSLIGIKLKPKDQDLLRQNLKQEKSQFIDYMQFFYRVKKWNDQDSQYETELQMKQSFK